MQKTKIHKKIIENIDIGGPTMVRAAAKNYNDVTTLTSLDQYPNLINQLNKNNGSTSLEFRKKMSQIAFTETAYYDSFDSKLLLIKSQIITFQKKIFHSKFIEKLRYGENPHQQSAIYSLGSSLNLSQLHGKQLSYNNYNDINAALTISNSLPNDTGVVIIKHANPVVVSIIKDKLKSYKSALACDPVSAFGGVINLKLALEIKVIIAKLIKMLKLALELNKMFIFRKMRTKLTKSLQKNLIKMLSKF